MVGLFSQYLKQSVEAPQRLHCPLFSQLHASYSSGAWAIGFNPPYNYLVRPPIYLLYYTPLYAPLSYFHCYIIIASTSLFSLSLHKCVLSSKCLMHTYFIDEAGHIRLSIKTTHPFICPFPWVFRWGIFLIGVPVFSAASPTPWGFVTVLSPLLTMALLLFLSGMPTAEGVRVGVARDKAWAGSTRPSTLYGRPLVLTIQQGLYFTPSAMVHDLPVLLCHLNNSIFSPFIPKDNQKRFLEDSDVKRRYLEYRSRTSPLVPMPPALYVVLPMWFKRSFLFELKLYETDWNYGAEIDGSSSDRGSS